MQKMFLRKEGFNMAEIIITSNKFILRSTGYKNVFLFINSEQNIKFNAKTVLTSWKYLPFAQGKLNIRLTGPRYQM